MFDAAKIMNELLGAGSGNTSTGKSDVLQKGKEYLGKNSGSLASGAVAGGLAGFLLGSKKGRKMTKKAAKYGGMALVAGLAYKAYSNYQTQKQAPQEAQPQGRGHASAPEALDIIDAQDEIPSVPEHSAFALANNFQSQQGFSAMLISAMIAAAKADGQIDGGEHQAIFAKVEELGLDNEAKAFIFDQLNKPLDIDSLVDAATNEEQAVELYLASLMAIDVDTAAEQAYLNMLAARLELAPQLVEQIHQTIHQITHQTTHQATHQATHQTET